jgi:Flp pilus assembly protein TadG
MALPPEQIRDIPSDSSPLSNRSSGQVIALFALSIMAMVALLALIFDGGNIYLQRRTAQNSADAAALAGARALQQAVGPSDTTISSEICKYSLANAFGVVPGATAYFVGVNGTTNVGAITLPGSCSGSSSNTISNGLSGVHVDITINVTTYLAGVIGFRSVVVRASSTAQVGRGGVPRPDLAPLAGCGPDMLVDGTKTIGTNILNPDGITINEALVGLDVVLEGSQMTQHEDATCPGWNGVSSAWKGQADISGVSGTLTPPIQLPISTGNSSLDSAVGTACVQTGWADPTNVSAPPPDVCLLLVPIAAPPNPSNQANIVTLACFSVYDGGSGAQKWRGVLHKFIDCKDAVFTATSTGTSFSETRVMLTQ